MNSVDHEGERRCAPISELAVVANPDLCSEGKGNHRPEPAVKHEG
jgi:hypothetical protein